MKILLLTDSLALPREWPEKCPYEKTWPQLLKKEGYDIHQVSLGGGTSRELLRQCRYHKSFNPDIVIIQVGIVDCVPRFVTRKEKNILQALPIVGGKVLSLLNKNWIRKLRSISYIKKKEFLKNLNKIISFYDCSKTFLVEIVGGEGYERVLPKVKDKINIYNEVLKSFEEVNYIEYYKKGITMGDYHHLNKKGHFQLYKEILSNLK
jgi:hypothetical protein